MRINLKFIRSRMINRFHQSGSFVVLIGIRSVGLRGQNEVPFKKLAEDKNVLFVPIFSSEDGMLFYVDARGRQDVDNKRFAGRLEKILQPWLSQLRPPP